MTDIEPSNLHPDAEIASAPAVEEEPTQPLSDEDLAAQQAVWAKSQKAGDPTPDVEPEPRDPDAPEDPAG